jgi:hypothetical protein
MRSGVADVSADTVVMLFMVGAPIVGFVIAEYNNRLILLELLKQSGADWAAAKAARIQFKKQIINSGQVIRRDDDFQVDRWMYPKLFVRQKSSDARGVGRVEGPWRKKGRIVYE